MSVDIIIPTMGESSLDFSLAAIEKSMSVNHIILIGPEGLRSRYKDKKKVKVIVSDKNVGVKRSLGLQNVATEYFACVDSDVIINRKWFEWCMQTIANKRIAVCEAFGKDIGKHTGRFRLAEFQHGKDWLGLGCAMLNTEIIRKLGMPEKPYAEDRELHRRVLEAGYLWVFNPNILCQHLVTDLLYWKHCAKWGERGGKETLTPFQWLSSVVGILTKGLLTYELSDCIFICVSHFFRLYGYSKRMLKGIHT